MQDGEISPGSSLIGRGERVADVSSNGDPDGRCCFACLEGWHCDSGHVRAGTIARDRVSETRFRGKSDCPGRPGGMAQVSGIAPSILQLRQDFGTSSDRFQELPAWERDSL